MFRKEKRRLILPACCGALALGTALLLSSLRMTGADMTVTALDVGQGQSLVLTSGTYTVVIDCGGSGSNAGDRAADYLASMGRTRIDALILTHWHDDHVNGVAQLLARTKVDRLIFPQDADDGGGNAQTLSELAAREAELYSVTEPTKMTLGEMVLQIYPPIGGSGENEMGLCILSSSGDYDVLVTGDMESSTERRLIERCALPDIELLVAGHHGSKNAGCEELLSAVKPETVFISVGADNAYGHPAEETLARYSKIGADVYRTDKQGNCTVRIEHG